MANSEHNRSARDHGRSRATGHISVVQEERFVLVTDDGKALQLDLARDARLRPADLRRLHETGARVEVEYMGEPGLASAGARSVLLLPAVATAQQA
jgi:hypothetical protein